GVAVETLHAQDREIWEIQGAGSASPFIGDLVTTSNNVVTAVGETYFFIQTPSERSDNDPNTSDGLFIYTGDIPTLQVGDLVNVSGIVIEFDGLTEMSGSSVSYAVVGSGAELPAAVPFTPSFPSPEAVDVRDLEKVEAMRVTFDAAVVSPARGSNPTCGLAVAPRPFREAGIRYPGEGAGLPVWDGNPELFFLDPDQLNQPDQRFLSFGQRVAGTGVLYQVQDRFVVFPSDYSVSGTLEVRELPSAANDQFTIGSINVLNLRADNEALATKYPKLARYIINQLGAPDVIALQEVGEMAILQELRFQILQLAPQLNYTAYLLEGNNNTFINNAYLVRQRIQDVNVIQLGNAENYSEGGRLHDRPPLLLTANLPTNPPTPIQVLNLHIRSLNGSGGSNDDFIYGKRHEQAISISNMVQARQAENLVVVGDFNAFPFSDGYVDVMSQITGTPSLGAERPVQSIVSPPLVNHAFAQASAERYSFIFDGSAQLIDHCLTTELTDLSVANFTFTRGNADAATAYFANTNISTRSSDHDGFVLYLEAGLPVATAVEAPHVIRWLLPNPLRAGAELPLPKLDRAVDLQLWTVHGQLLQQWAKVQSQVTLPNVPAGTYLLRWTIGEQSGIEKLVVE
ncbi:MAG: endonuclease/exonuclease/phosphatase family protein, partial [Bacteroidota bacterium]